MTDTASTTSPTPTGPAWTRWLYRILAIVGIAVGIAVGIVVIIAVVYLLFAKSDCCSMMKADPPAAQSKDCCASMMKGMKMPMENRPSMSPMPNMPMPAPGR